ncbi:MAG: SsrA-binding protein SmpB [Clostridia bacterium]
MAKIVIRNKIIHHDYLVLDTYEGGLELKGTEVKSIREGKANLKDSFAIIKDGELILKNMHISPYEFGNRENADPLRDRKVLLHKTQIINLLSKIKQGGYTIVPKKIYFVGKWVKIEVCLCKGKKDYDKREDLKKKEAVKNIKNYI